MVPGIRLGSSASLALLLIAPATAWPQGMHSGHEFRVNTFTLSDQLVPAMASDGSGNFVVVWSSADQDGSIFGSFGQRYDSTGAPLGPEFRINTYTTDSQFAPAVAAIPSGAFVVIWDSRGQ